MNRGLRFHPGFAILFVSAIAPGLLSSALFAQSGPVLDSPLPAPRPLPAGAPAEDATWRRVPTEAPVEELAPAPREAAAPLTAQPPRPLGEEAAPMPREQTPAPPLLMPNGSRPAVPMELQRLHQEIEGLRLEREAMLLEELDLITNKEARAARADEGARLRQRVTELLLHAAQQNRKRRSDEAKARPEEPRKAASSAKPLARRDDEKNKTTPSLSAPLPRHERDGSLPLPSPTPEKKTAVSDGGKAPVNPPEKAPQVLTDAPVDPQSLAQSLFLSGDYASALNAYRQLEQGEQRPDERIVLQYMTACCLRKLGKLDEAALLYREVANSGGSDILIENAQWYLRVMKDRRELEAQLNELRQRREALMPRKS